MTTTAVRLRPPSNRVSARAIAMWTVRNFVSAIITVALAAGVAAWVDVMRPGWLVEWIAVRSWWLVAVAALVALPGVLIEPGWRYRVHRWEVGSDVVYTRTGWFNRQWQLVPVSRVQTVDTSQGWLERAFGLATIKISTASHAGSSEVAGLPVALATRLAEELAQRAHELRDDAT